MLLGVDMGNNLTVSMSAELLDSIFEGAKRLYPKETFLLLRGKKSKDAIRVLELVVPPLAVYGYGFAHLPFHMLPMDFSVVGTVHSHPSGNINPSSVDINHFFGRILMIVGFPFAGAENVAVYGSKGEKLQLQITKE
jgi:proteasome lid subunit RPN8/RPN11